VTTDYALCLYDFGPPRRLVLDAEVPGGGMCGARRPKPCWKSTKAGFQYKDADGASEGVRSILLQEGLEPGKAKIVWQGKGALLAVPSPLDLVPPITVQLVNEAGRCWEATYSAPAQLEASKFKGKADPPPGPRPTRTLGPSRTVTPTPHRTATPKPYADVHDRAAADVHAPPDAARNKRSGAGVLCSLYDRQALRE